MWFFRGIFGIVALGGGLHRRKNVEVMVEASWIGLVQHVPVRFPAVGGAVLLLLTTDDGIYFPTKASST